MVDTALSSPVGRVSPRLAGPPPSTDPSALGSGPGPNWSSTRAPHDFASLSSLRMEDLIPGPMDHLQPPDLGELGQTQVGGGEWREWVGGWVGSRPFFCMTKPGAPSRWPPNPQSFLLSASSEGGLI